MVLQCVAGQQHNEACLSTQRQGQKRKLTGAILGACVTISETSAASGMESEWFGWPGEAEEDDAAISGAAVVVVVVVVGDEFEDVVVIVVEAAGDSTGRWSGKG
jgi:hypothetical protein